MLSKMHKHLSIIGVMVVMVMVLNETGLAFSFAGKPRELSENISSFRLSEKDGNILGAGVYLYFLILLLVRIWPALFPEPPPPRRTYSLETERKFLRYETHEADEIIATSSKIGISDRLLEEGRYTLVVHLDRVESVRLYGDELWEERLFRVYHDDGSRELKSKKEVKGETIVMGKKEKLSPLSNAQIRVTMNADLLKAGIVVKTDEYGNVHVPLYSAKPFLEIEGTRTRNYGLALKTKFLSQEKFRDYQSISVNLSYKDTTVIERIKCYSLERSVKEFIDSEINSNISPVRFVVEDIESHAPVYNPTIKIKGTPPTKGELLGSYFSGEYNTYATKFVENYLRGTREVKLDGAMTLYRPFSYIVQVDHPKYRPWKKKIYVDGSKTEYIIRLRKLGMKTRGEIIS